MDRPAGHLGRRLPRSFYARSAPEVAADLVGRDLVLRDEAGLIRLRLVEVEAYLGEGADPASHAHRGPTPRNAQMFATPGSLYVYVSYGVHHCLNVVCEPRGTASAVLLRAAQPLAGEEILAIRRGRGGRELTNGPGKLGQALGAELGWNGRDLVRGPLGLWPGRPPDRVATSGRIGISLATDVPLRFFDPASPWVSRARVVL